MDIPQIGFGTWTLKGKECIEAVKEAILLGYRHIDTAQMYGNEIEVGKAIKESNINRKDIFITTKICAPNTTYELTKKAVFQSLENLGLDYIDLVLIHEPYSTFTEMYKALEELKNKGIIRFIGVSNFNKQEILKLLKNCAIKPYVNQIEMHIFYQQENYRSFLHELGIRVVAWSPLCANPKEIIDNLILTEISRKYYKSNVQIALKFLLQNDVVIIPKTLHKDRMKENLNIMDFSLSNEDIEKIKLLDQNKSKFGWYY